MSNLSSNQSKGSHSITTQLFPQLLSAVLLPSMAAVWMMAILSSCTSGNNAGPVEAELPQGVACANDPCVPPGQIPPGSTGTVRLSNGADILIQNVSGKLMYEVEGVLTAGGFAGLQQELANLPQAEAQLKLKIEMQKILGELSAKVGAIPGHFFGEVGYFSTLVPLERELFGSLKSAAFSRAIAVNPVVYDPNILRDIKALNPESTLGLRPRASVSELEAANYSGLVRIKADRFKDAAERVIGGQVVVDGSSVRVGITDTGITYNHPSFLSGISHRPRIVYMKDFTGEGTVFIHPSARFVATQPPVGTGGLEDLNVEAQIIVTPKVPSRPLADQLVDVQNLHIKVSPSLKEILLRPDSGAKLGVLFEDSLQAERDPVDINANGKLDDKLYVIYVPGRGGSPDTVYFDSTGTADFRNSPAIKDFNASGDVVKVFAEKIGFHIADSMLMNSRDQQIPVKAIAMVGYDPGNHGTHVAGISSGLRTLANDRSMSLARGVAPESIILMNRVCANNGGCGATAALVDLALNGNADVVNMSLGGLSPFNDGYGVQETTINRLTQLKNVLFVISAGNSGPGRQTVGSPSTARLALSVGASASRSMIARQYQYPGAPDRAGLDVDDDFMLFFSSRGPTASGGFKPMVSAPGTELSAIQLNAAPGARSGLDVYWGTSMAAPTATGAYALLLDAVRKYNQLHSSRPMPTDVTTLRQVLIESARPSDMNMFEPGLAGSERQGQHTLIDQGTGIVDLVAAWEKLLVLRGTTAPSDVRFISGDGVALDYQVITSLTPPHGTAYNGSRPSAADEPAFGSGLYLSYNSLDQTKEVYVARRLPEHLLRHSEAGDLHRQLVTTSDTFRLRTVIYGSHKEWLRAGVDSSVDCAQSVPHDLRVVGRGVEVTRTPQGTGSVVSLRASTLHVCLDRRMMTDELPPGDHSALIYGYRVGDGGDVSTVASFVVPVFLTVPHKTLQSSTGYQFSGNIKSFQVARNYISVPQGTTLVRVKIEVPALKLDERGRPLAGEHCSGVELMALFGGNTTNPVPERPKARIANCQEDGTPRLDAKDRTLELTVFVPKPGVWDINLFGQYKFKSSDYQIKVDYVTAQASLAEIVGDISALSGNLEFTVRESSLPAVPSPQTSDLSLSGLMNKVASRVAHQQFVIVASSLGLLRTYPAEVSGVDITTENSPGNDIDLAVFECPSSATAVSDPGCAPIGVSGGASDLEKVHFVPRAGKVYAVRVDGYLVQGAGDFESTESLEMPAESYPISISGTQAVFQVNYAVTPEQMARSAILQNPLFVRGLLSTKGTLSLRMIDKAVLAVVPVRVRAH